jgi:Protein of unknown function (DUF1822)
LLFLYPIIMNVSDQLTPVTIPLTAAERSQAQAFSQQQPTPAKATQVYRNTLAVLAVKRYLQLLGIDSDLDQSHSWQAFDRLSEDIADLYIPEADSYLECRAIYPNDHKCPIPPTSLDKRLGYVVLQIDTPYRESHLLGFTPDATVAELPLSYLQPLDDLIEAITIPAPQPVSNWLKGVVTAHWQRLETILSSPEDPGAAQPITPAWVTRGDTLHKRIETLYNLALVKALVKPDPAIRSANASPQNTISQPNASQPNASQPADISLASQSALTHLMQMTTSDEIRWQAAELLWELDPHHPQTPVMMLKDLGLYLKGHHLALVVGILPKADQRFLTLLRITPMAPATTLPPGLKFIGLDDSHARLFEIESRQRDEYIQFKLTAETGDAFSIQIVLDDATYTESFMV